MKAANVIDDENGWDQCLLVGVPEDPFDLIDQLLVGRWDQSLKAITQGLSLLFPGGLFAGMSRLNCDSWLVRPSLPHPLTDSHCRRRVAKRKDRRRQCVAAPADKTRGWWNANSFWFPKGCVWRRGTPLAVKKYPSLASKLSALLGCLLHNRRKEQSVGGVTGPSSTTCGVTKQAGAVSTASVLRTNEEFFHI